MLAGCASARVLQVARATSDTPCLVPAPERDVLVGVALSGGGSRAALFGAAGLEALSDIRTPDGSSLLEQISLVSASRGKSGGQLLRAQQPEGRACVSLCRGICRLYRAF
jgi:hypothetical protein